MSVYYIIILSVSHRQDFQGEVVVVVDTSAAEHFI